MRHKTFLKNAAVVSAGGAFAKGIGALYRIPLMAMLGGYGMGLYQMTYPLFCLLLTFSSAGIPSAFSRVISEDEARGTGGRQTLGTALRLFSAIGLCAAVLMCLSAPAMSALQGDKSLVACYLSLAPSVFFVALIAVFRGYFQGKRDMIPTAASEIAEQTVKAALGLFLAARCAANERAVVCALGAVSVSEAAALVLLWARLRAEGKRTALFTVRRRTGRELFSAVLPVMLSCALLPLSQTADSVLIVRLLPCEPARAVALYGLFSGGAVALVNLPASFCYGLSAAAVPAVSTCFARGEREEGKKRAAFALAVTLLSALPFAAALPLFAPQLVRLLYPALSAQDAAVLVLSIRLLALSSVFLAGVNTLSACLTGMGRAKRAAGAMAAAVLLKTLLQIALIPRLSVSGAAIAANACYLVAFSLDLFYTVTEKTKRRRYDHDRRLGNGKGRSDGAGACRPETRAEGARAKFVARIGRVARGRD